MRATPAFAVLILMGAPALAAQQTQDETEIESQYRRLLTADAVRDTAAFGELFAPGYTFVPPRGDTVLSREQRIAAAAVDTSALESRPRYTLHGCRTQVHGQTAVAHCRYVATLRLPGAGADSTREFISTAVLMKNRSRWRFIATHPAPVRRR